MNKPRNLKKFLDGKLPLPAGFVPLAEYGNQSALLCLAACDAWFHLIPKRKEFLHIGKHPIHQKDAMQAVIATLGGTSAKAAKAIGVSPRTVESWRCGRKRLTVERAYEIAQAMANQ